MPTASELSAVKQKIQNRYAKIELLNENFQVVDSLEGVTLNGSTTVDANSDMRRNATIKFIVTDSSFEVNSGGKIFLDKYIRIYLGIDSMVENQIVYSNIGTYIVDAPTYEYDAMHNSIQLNLIDLMNKLSGVRGGYISAPSILIPAGTNIRQVMIDTLALGGFTRYVIAEAPYPSVVPNDLSFSQGATIYNILAQLKNIYPNYEIFFDVDGVFHYQPIPTGKNEPVVMDDTLWKDIVLSENSEKVDVDFQNIKNRIEVWGRTHDPAYFSTQTTISGNNIKLTIADVTNYENELIYGFTLNLQSSFTPTTLNINNLTIYNLKQDSEENIILEGNNEETYYCVQYIYNSGNPYFRWLGHLQAYGMAQDENPDSPYYINSSIGTLLLPLFGGEYDNCMTDDLAYQRAKYELYMHTNMQNSITLSCLPVYWLEVNTLVEYTLLKNNQKGQYLIKSFSYGFDIDDKMTITMIKYYPEYSDI